jgi:hypothetical protein
MKTLKMALVAATALGGAFLVSGSASAMPVGGLAAASKELSTDIQDVRWVCGYYRCWWQPNYYYSHRRYGYRHYGYRYGRPRPYAYGGAYRSW